MNNIMNFFELLNLRYEFNTIVLRYRIPRERKDGTLDNLQYFLNNARHKNKFRTGFGRAEEIAKIILYEEKKCRTKKATI